MFRKMSLTKMVSSLFVFAGVIPLLAASFFLVSGARQSLDHELVKSNGLFLDATINEMNLYFESVEKLSQVSSKNSVLYDGLDAYYNKDNKTTVTNEDGTTTTIADTDASNAWVTGKSNLDKYAKATAEEYGFSGIFVTDNTGLIIYDDTASLEGVDLSSREYIQTSFSGSQNWSDVFFSEFWGGYVLVNSTPIYKDGGSGEVVGTFNIILEESALSSVLHVGIEELGETADAFLVGSDGLLLTNMKQGEYSVDAAYNTDLSESYEYSVLKEYIANGDTSFRTSETFTSFSDKEVLGSLGVLSFGAKEIGIVLEVDSDEALASVKFLTLISYAIIGVLVVLGSLFAFLIIRAIVKHINTLTDVANKVSQGHVNIDMDRNHGRKDQIGKLTDAFIRVIDGNKEKASMMDSISNGDFAAVNVDENAIDPVLLGINKVVNNLNYFSDQIYDLSKLITVGDYKEEINTSELKGEYNRIAEQVNKLMTIFVNQFDDMPTGIITLDKDKKIVYVNKYAAHSFDRDADSIVGDNINEHLHLADGRMSSAFENDQEHRGQDIMRTKDNKEVFVEFTGKPIKSMKGETVGSLEIIVDQTDIKLAELKTLKQARYQEEGVELLVKNLEKLSTGNFDFEFFDLEYDADTEDVARLFKSIDTNLDKSAHAIQSYIKDINDILSSLADGNLDITVSREYVGDFRAIKDALKMIIDSFNGVIETIRDSSINVATSAKQVSQASESLSQGATQQAASIEEISATVTQVAAQVQENAKNSQRVNDNAQSAVAAAGDANKMMGHLDTSMKEIQKSTANIQKVLKMINDIAFQTNILSLNAAVEAARAGQHGKGFAVIAEDVRNLALKSAKAADETTDMLDSIVSQINDSVSYAKDTAKSLNSISEGSEETFIVSAEVATASNEQAVAISQITLSLDQISQVVQESSQAATQSAYTSKELMTQSSELIDLVQQFELRDSKEINIDFGFDKLNQTEVEDEIKITLSDDFTQF